MKRKIVMTLCAAACAGMLFGCGKKETPVTEEISAGTVEAPEEERNTDENLPEEETEPETDDAETSEEETDTVKADGGNAQENGQKESYTADEMVDMLSQHNKHIIYAIQRGDLFYPIQGTGADGNYVNKNDGNMLMPLDADFTIPTVNYAQGEALVVFRDVNYGSFDIEKALDTSEHYCIPFTFQANNNGEYISRAGLVSETSDTYLDDAFDFMYANSSFKYTEYDGNLVPEDGNSMYCLMEGEKDEIKELGGYEGSMYKSVRLKCTARYYELAPLGDYAGQTQPTQNGYEIISDGSVNPLEGGIYTVGITPWNFFEIINE